MVAIIRDRTITNTCHFNLLHIIIITWTKLNSLLSGNQQLKWALMQYYCVLRKRYQSTIFSSIYLRVRYNELYKGNWLICSYVIFYCDSTAPGIRIPVCCIYILVLNALKMSLMIKKFVSSQKRRFIQVIRIFSDDSPLELAIVGLNWSRLQMIWTDCLLMRMDIILPWK